MTKESEQRSNLKWLVDLLSRPLEFSTGKAPGLIVSGFRDEGTFDREIFFSLSDVSLDKFAMQFYFDDSLLSNKSLSYLKDKIDQNAIIVGYELSEQTRRVLNKIGYTYIDIWLHPVRFADDVLFAIQSNNPLVNQEIARFSVNEELFYLHADRLRVQNYRGFRRGKAKLLDNSALFVGQTLNDKAICSKGKMLTLLDFSESFSQLRMEYSHVYYSRHPFVKIGDERIISFVTSFNNVSLIDTPTYELLASSEINKVVTISSSVATEAKYFGKSYEYYFRPPVDVAYDKDNSYYTVSAQLFTSHFWSIVLSRVFKTTAREMVSFESPKDKLRDALSFYWGYRNIDKLESLKQTVAAMRASGKGG